MKYRHHMCLAITFLAITACALHAPSMSTGNNMSPGNSGRFNANEHLHAAAEYALSSQFDLALNEIAAVIAVQPDNADAYLTRGAIFGVMGRYPDAVADLRKSANMGNARAQDLLDAHSIHWEAH